MLRHISVEPSDLNAALLETGRFIEVGATQIIYHVPVPDPLGILRRLAQEVAEPLMLNTRRQQKKQMKGARYAQLAEIQVVTSLNQHARHAFIQQRVIIRQ